MNFVVHWSSKSQHPGIWLCLKMETSTDDNSKMRSQVWAYIQLVLSSYPKGSVYTRTKTKFVHTNKNKHRWRTQEEDRHLGHRRQRLWEKPYCLTVWFQTLCVGIMGKWISTVTNADCYSVMVFLECWQDACSLKMRTDKIPLQKAPSQWS